MGGVAYRVSVTMKNTGTSTWTGAYLYRLGAWNPQDNTTWGVSRAMLPRSVAPNEEVTFDFLVIAPLGGTTLSEEGGGFIPNQYNFQWRMLKDGVDSAQWFGDPSQNVVVNSYGSYSPFESSYAPSNHYTARLEPRNRTGVPSEDLLSGNYNWSLPILGLAGRAGLDLGLSLTYNSLVWTPLGSMIWDADRGFPSPGFRLGFPTIQAKFYNDQAHTNSYMLITPSGRRVELRQIGTSNVYESVDSSYMQLTEDANGLLLRPTNGSQMTYKLVNGASRWSPKP